MHCRPNTFKHYGLMVRKHIVPGLADLRVSEVRRNHILMFQYGLSDMPTVRIQRSSGFATLNSSRGIAYSEKIPN